jgi:photosystem II stability/assembly factor-like uncharacterized protein
MGHQAKIVVQEERQTRHDGLFAIHRSGDKIWVVGKHGLILHSERDGKNWKKQDSRTVRALTGVSFADDQHGFVVGNGGTILATTDGGLSWRAQSSGTDEQLLGVQALSETEAWVVGAFGTILSTSDGGKNWNRQTLNWKKLIPRVFEESLALEPNLNGVHFVNRKVGWVVGEFGLILCTNDGGQSWISQRYDIGFPQLCATKFQDHRTGWAVGQKGSLIRTLDGGQHWVPLKVGTEKDLYAISLHDQYGVVVGDGIVLKTKDGGSTWEMVESIPDHWFSGAAIMNMSKAALVVGQAGAIHLINLKDAKGGFSTDGK